MRVTGKTLNSYKWVKMEDRTKRRVRRCRKQDHDRKAEIAWRYWHRTSKQGNLNRCIWSAGKRHFWRKATKTAWKMLWWGMIPWISTILRGKDWIWRRSSAWRTPCRFLETVVWSWSRTAVFLRAAVRMPWWNICRRCRIPPVCCLWKMRWISGTACIKRWKIWDMWRRWSGRMPDS